MQEPSYRFLGSPSVRRKGQYLNGTTTTSLCILMSLVNTVLKIIEKGDSEGRKGPVEI